jgi:hypothetical protein
MVLDLFLHLLIQCGQKHNYQKNPLDIDLRVYYSQSFTNLKNILNHPDMLCKITNIGSPMVCDVI